MVTFEVYFLSGRFHATPWDRHVNEGVVEWPISPWRILRGLIAVGFRKLGWDDINPPQEARELMELLSNQPPEYWLPPASTGHSRHYMPKYRSGLDGKTDRVIDAFVAVDPRKPVVVHWPNIELNDGQHWLLGELLTGLSYLGRAESWVEAKLGSGWDGEPNAMPVNGNRTDPRFERISLLCPVSSDEYSSWRNSWLDSSKRDLLENKRQKAKGKNKTAGNVKLTGKENAKLEGSIPDRIFNAMLADTGDLRAVGWNRPPGSFWVDYSRPADCFAIRPARRKSEKVRSSTVARFALAADSVQADVRPRLVDTVYLADNMRKALMSLSGHENEGVPSKTFSGKAEDGKPLRGHQHAFFLPVDDDNDSRIEGVIVFAPKGFSKLDQLAMGRLRKLWQHSGRPGLFPVLTGIGQLEDFGGLDAKKGVSPLLAEAAVWESRTPFVLMRHCKTRKSGEPKLREDGSWIDGPLDQLMAEIGRRGLPQPETIEWLDHTTSGGKKLYWYKFARFRKGGSGACAGGAHGFRLIFPKPVRGPIALGYGCHFGLGQFWAVA